MLKPVFFWLDNHPGSYWWFAVAGTLPLVARLAGAFRPSVAGREPARSDRWLDALALLLFLFAWRWPFLLVAHELNTDESQFIGGTLALARDPAFWRGTDGITSGPVNFYVLLPLAWLGLPLDYFTARLTGLILAWAALFVCHRVLSDLFDRAVAWLAVLPAAVFLATTSDPDFVHYSSETAAICLTALAAWRLVRAAQNRAWGELVLAGAVAGCLPWAKLQAAPIGAVLVGVALWRTRPDRLPANAPRWRRVALVALAGLAPTLLIVGVAAATCGVDPIVHRYLEQNLFYAQGGQSFAQIAGYFSRFALNLEAGRTVRFPMQDGRLFWLLLAAAAAVLAAALRCGWRREKPHPLFVTGGLLTAAAVIAVLGPRRASVHYFLFLLVPLTLWTGAALGTLWAQLRSQNGRWLVAAGCLLLGGLLPLATRGLQPEPFIFGQFSDHWRHPRSGEAEIVRRLAGPDGSIAVWGWGNYLYAETGLPPAGRDAQNQWSIDDSVQRDYYRSVYLADLKAARPPVFVDAVGPGAFRYPDRAPSGHESFAELADYVREHYELVADWGRVRIYARPGRARETGLDQAALDNARRERGPFHTLWPGSPPPVGSTGGFQVDFLYRRAAMMLFPPARLEWELDETVRSVDLEYCFRPTAFNPGHTNGVDYFLELLGPDNTRLVAQRRLLPVSFPADRGLQSERIVLPPFQPGTRLVLRTGPGEANDTGWDWFYLARLRFERSAGYVLPQFPGFNRPPETVTGNAAAYLDDGSRKRLFLHAPCVLTFALQGHEQKLEFAYGMELSAYSEGGQTDGVAYRVVLQRAGENNRVIFERSLRPREQAGDRGEQTSAVTLPEIHRGDRLLLELDGGPNGNFSWDQTFLRRLSLK